MKLLAAHCTTHGLAFMFPGALRLGLLSQVIRAALAQSVWLLRFNDELSVRLVETSFLVKTLAAHCRSDATGIGVSWSFIDCGSDGGVDAAIAALAAQKAA